MNEIKVIVCSENLNPFWLWISHHFPPSVHWYFYRATQSTNKFLTVLHRSFACIQAVLKSRRANVIVSHGPYIAVYCAFFSWFFRIKPPHVVYSFNFSDLPVGLSLKRMIFAFNQIDRFVVSSNMERALYSNHFNIPIDKIDFVRWGVAEPDFNLQSPVVNGEYVSAVGGNARDYKTFMAAMAGLPEIQAVVVMRPQNLIDLDVPNNVKVLVNTSKDDALSVIKNSSLMVLPLLGSEIPCGHVTIVAAMYLGIPCIVTNSSGVCEYVIHKKTGILCDPNSVEAMKFSITQLLSKKQLRLKLATEAEAFVCESCSEKNYASHLEDLMN